MHKKIILLFIIMVTVIITGLKSKSESNYQIFTPMTYSYSDDNNECILFILDYSQSMNEKINGISKKDILKYAFYKISNQIPQNEKLGLRVYGHKRGFLITQACKASENLVNITTNSCNEITNVIEKLKPSGMTPITYSLKQAVQKDFVNCNGLKHIILITDGGENCDESPCEYAIKLVKERSDIKIDVIAVDLKNKNDLSQLECTAFVTNGKIYNANSIDDIEFNIIKAINFDKEVEGKIIPR